MNLGSLVSETRNPQTMDLDALSTLELVNRLINRIRWSRRQ
jgi:N-acetylmuramic acid 6-phosphate etherase